MQAKKTKRDVFVRKTEEILSATGFSKTALAKFVGISRPMFYAYLNGEKPVSAKALNLLGLAQEKLKDSARFSSPLITADKKTDADIKKLMAIRDEIESAFKEIDGRLKNIDAILKTKKF